MRKEDAVPNDFIYNGRLVFNSLISTNVKSGDAEEIREQLLDNLLPFSRGSPNSSSSGFDEIDFKERAEGHGKIDERLQEVADKLIGQRFVKEQYIGVDEEEIVNVEGNRTDGWIRQTNESYVYWNYPDYIFIQGAQSKVDDTRRAINAALGESTKLNEIPLDPDFLLWLLYRYDKHNGSLPGPISIERLSTSETYGELENFGRRNKVEDSGNIAFSVPLITAILYQMKLRLLQGEFKIGSYDVTGKINTSGRLREGSGRVHVMSGGDIEKSTSHLRRALIANFYVSELIALYRRWENMEPKDKYPPLTYFDEMAGTALDRNVDLSKVDVTDLLREYSNKRGTDPDPADFDHLVEEDETT